jgi:cohesin complex subunit SA-1/2
MHLHVGTYPDGTIWLGGRNYSTEALTHYFSPFFYDRIAHPLTDGPVEVDKIKIELTDHIVHSLREMPEHKSLTTSWTAMLKAIRSENPQQGRQEKEEVAKTGILLRILACAAKLEVGQEAEENSKRRKRDSATSNQTREALSQALLKTLPGLLTSFKTDQMSMRSLTKLPQYLLPEIYSLPTRKSDFSSLVKNLCVAFLESTDEESLLEISNSLSIFVQGDHARVSDVKAQLKRVSTALQDRLMELFAESDPDKETSSTPNKGKRKRSSRRSDASSSMDSDGVFSNSKEADIEHSICLCLTRWRILLKKVPLSFLFDESEEDDENEVEGFCKTITEALGKRLVDRKPTIDDEADEGQTVGSRSAAIASVWKSEDLAIHSEVSHAIDTGLDVLLCIVSWKLADTTKSKQENAQLGVVDEDEDDAAGDLLVVRLRDGLSKLLGLCYEQFLEDLPGLVYSDEQADFSAAVQTSAGRVGSDLRTMFPREWSLAKDPTLRALALQDDSHLIGGFVRYLQSRGEDFEETDAGSKEEVALVKELLQPVARALTANWTNGNRKEAGVILSHLTGSGKLAGSTVHGMARLLKKVGPIVAMPLGHIVITASCINSLSRFIQFDFWSHRWLHFAWHSSHGLMVNQKSSAVIVHRKSKCNNTSRPRKSIKHW